ncbi:hypothetical protein ykris0001_44550 [Yersinia kristensenii ATCC 33638]|nr:hypothetical protein ykris0001_44550 [Yersinia kristensenii ATCC 33638]
MSFFATVIDSINKETNRIQIHELIITEETVRNIASRTEKSTTQ